MKLYSGIRCGLLLLGSTMVAGCSSTSGWETQSANDDFVDGIHILGEAILLPSREDVLQNKGVFTNWSTKLQSAGYAESDIVDGSEVSVWAYCYGWNSGVDICTHHGHYVAHVPDELQGQITSALDPGGAGSGDLLEVELRRNPEGFIVGSVKSVYRPADNWGSCYQARLQNPSATGSILMTLGGVGPARAIWIECAGVDVDGWQRRPLVGVPVSTGAPISEWVKIPDE